MFTCKNCSKTFESKDKRRKFCSQSCSSSFNNKGVARNPKKHFNRKCMFCEKEFKLTRINRNNKHCLLCVENRAFNIKHSLEEIKNDKTRRMFLIRKLGHSCQVCNNSTWNDMPIPLEVDHIDGNYQNNTHENLRLICPNCHAQTPTYKNKNKGNGRYKRKQRFQEGKSY